MDFFIYLIILKGIFLLKEKDGNPSQLKLYWV